MARFRTAVVTATLAAAGLAPGPAGVVTGTVAGTVGAAVTAPVSAPAAAAAAGLTLIAVVAAATAGCSKKIPHSGELRARVLPSVPGQAPTEEDVRFAAAEVDIAIGELGIERRAVNPLPGGKLRIVLPESVSGRMPEVRTRLADPKLRIELE